MRLLGEEGFLMLAKQHLAPAEFARHRWAIRVIAVGMKGMLFALHGGVESFLMPAGQIMGFVVSPEHLSVHGVTVDMIMVKLSANKLYTGVAY